MKVWLAHHQEAARLALRRLTAAPLNSLLSLLAIGVALALIIAAVVLIGVSRTRSSPNSFTRSPLTPQTPPKAPTSSPITNTFSSRAISSRSASRMASR